MSTNAESPTGVQVQPDGSAAVIVAEGYYRIKEENERLKEWIREEGVRTDTCTYNILGEICAGCRCRRQPQQNVQGQARVPEIKP